MKPGVTYRIIRSSRKTIELSIPEVDLIVVRAPQRLSQAALNQYIESKQEWIDHHLERMKKRSALLKPEPTAEELPRFKQEALDILRKKVELLAPRMGVVPANIRITSAQKRLGSCNAKGQICFSYRLLCYPDYYVDYVVVHELAHLRQMNHSKAFYACVEAVLPDYRERIRRVRQATEEPLTEASNVTGIR